MNTTEKEITETLLQVIKSSTTESERTQAIRNYSEFVNAVSVRSNIQPAFNA